MSRNKRGYDVYVWDSVVDVTVLARHFDTFEDAARCADMLDSFKIDCDIGLTPDCYENGKAVYED